MDSMSRGVAHQGFQFADPLLLITSINQSINQSIDRSIVWSIDRSINQSISQSVNQSVSQSINQSINHSINQSINQPTNQPINQSIQPSINCVQYLQIHIPSSPSLVNYSLMKAYFPVWRCWSAAICSRCSPSLVSKHIN